jgi:hypothetical protein
MEIRVQPDHPAYAGLGKVFAETSDLKGAIADCRRA